MTVPKGALDVTLTRLVARAQQGDTLAFDALVRRFQDMAVGYSAALLGGDFHWGQDAAQEAFLEAYRTLPCLRQPAAFPGWLRLLVRKHCDRLTRRGRGNSLPLESAIGLAAADDPAREVVAQERRVIVRTAVVALSPAERDVILLFYMGERSHREIAAFLEVPVSTVKNRLYSARRRLKERMVNLMEETLREQRPSNDDHFRDRVFVRLQDEFFAQYRRDPETADRALMRQAREEFDRYAASIVGPLDREVAHFGSRLYSDLSDYAPLADLMARYRAQTLPLDEEAWARWEHIRALSVLGRCEEVVAEQRAFVAWAKERLPGAPPIRLSLPNNFRPLKEGGEGETLPADALRVWTLNISDVALCFKRLGLRDEWTRITLDVIAALPKTRANRLYRFWQLRNLVVQHYDPDSLAGALEATGRIRALADEETDWETPRWPIEALYMEMIAHTDAGDLATARARAEQAVQRLEALEVTLDPSVREQGTMFYTLCDNVASPLADRGHYELAARLFPKVLADGRGSGWAHLRYAACLWNTARDRDAVMELLRRGASRDLGDDLLPFFREYKGFADVADDPEFVAALTV